MAMETTQGDDPTRTMPGGNSLAVRKLAAKVAVAASEKSGRPVGPRVEKLAAMELTLGDDPSRTMPRRNSLAVRKLAAKVAVAFSEKSGRPVSPRVKALADS